MGGGGFLKLCFEFSVANFDRSFDAEMARREHSQQAIDKYSDVSVYVF